MDDMTRLASIRLALGLSYSHVEHMYSWLAGYTLRCADCRRALRVGASVDPYNRPIQPEDETP